MPTYLDFKSTKTLRDLLISKTIKRPNGPQTFTENNYVVKKLNDYPNIDLPDVDADRKERLAIPQKTNTFKPLEYLVVDKLTVLPRRANLKLYWDGTPYFTAGTHNLVSIFSTDKYETESELFKLSASYIKNDPNGPIQARIKQNLEASTIGRFRLIDALKGNTATAINIVTGKEPLIESNYKITVAKTAIGKGIDFLQTVSGTELPFSEIPGDYLTNPRNPINQRPEANTQAGAIIQDVTGALGSLIGIKRRPNLDRKPSDLMIEYLGDGQKNILFDLLSYSKYAPNYTTTARSQNSSKLFNVVDQFSQGVKTLLGNEAPRGMAYIGDDRGEDVKYAMNDFNDRPVRGSYFMSIMFDPVQAELFERSKTIIENNSLSGNLTWISKNSKNKLGAKNNEWGSQSSNIVDSLSTNYQFRSDSILGVTQELLDSMPTDGGAARSHVANAIDQTSRIFRDGTKMLSRGSAIKYVNEYGNETGAEYCRVWTKDRAYFNYSDTMRRTGTLRKYDDSVLSTPWNINIAPMSNGSRDFSSSTNIDDKEFYAKKYMLSIENLAWKTSNMPGFTYNDLPVCERGPNGGRIMWFPPYDFKFSEQNNATWEGNKIIGRPEPIYTYQYTERGGQISFKVVVDHPSILNLLVREKFKNMSDEESENYINAFFAGCEEIDFYDLINRYPVLDPTDAKIVTTYLNGGTDPDIILDVLPEKEDIVEEQPPIDEIRTKEFKSVLFFPNDIPTSKADKSLSTLDYTEIIRGSFKSDDYKNNALNNLESILNDVYTINNQKTLSDRLILLSSKDLPTTQVKTDSIIEQKRLLNEIFTSAASNYDEYVSTLNNIKNDIISGKTKMIKINISSTTSQIADKEYNYKLSIRRSHSIIREVVSLLKNNGFFAPDKFLTLDIPKSVSGKLDLNLTYSFKELGYTEYDGELSFKTTNYGENGSFDGTDCSQGDFKYEANYGSVTTSLTVTSPISFGCRKSEIKIEHIVIEQKNKNNLLTKESLSVNSPLKPVDESLIKKPISASKKDLLGPMKRIITKTLSECYYFKTLEESDPVVFSSLKEKLKYFHPGFHSTTPEGLNSRLTFLQQCIRPGDTIPVKGRNYDNINDARNTTFGPPPICVLRVGDFYHTKIIIRDINITFDESTWDLNPEGIGVQPMIADVSLQINFIGGHGLREPVSRLQNALSSNFYANTEMYDERSINTINDKTISNIEKSFFTKEFLDTIQKVSTTLKEEDILEDGNTKINGEYIGSTSEFPTISYSDLINNLYSSVNEYFISYEGLYNKIIMGYGPMLSSILLDPTYRTIKDFDLYKPSVETILIFGEYQIGYELSKLLSLLKNQISKDIDQVDILSLLELNKIIEPTAYNKASRLLKPAIKDIVSNKIDLMNDQVDKTFIDVRNKILSNLDKLNFLIKNEFDAKIDGEKATKSELSGFSGSVFYNEYEQLMNKFNDYTIKMYDDLKPNDIDFYNPTFTNDQLKEIILILIKDDLNILVNNIDIDKILFDINTTNNVLSKLEKLSQPKSKQKKFNFKEVKRKNQNIIVYQATEQDLTDEEVIEELKLINDTKTRKPINNKLNNFIVL